MTAALAIIALLLMLLLVPVTFVQVLYLDSLRLRSRELPALTYFKETLEARLGLKSEAGAFVYSLLKHGMLVLLGAAFVGVVVDGVPATPLAVLEGCLLACIAMLVSTYIVPQMLYRRTEGHWLSPLVPLLRLLALLLRPLTGVLSFLQSLVEMNRSEAKADEGSVPTAGHLDALIDAGTEEGLIEEEDRRLIQSAVAFGDKTVREVMTPRPNLVAISHDRSLEDLRQLVIHEQYSRIPVYGGTIDNIFGFIHVRDLFELDDEGRATKSVRELLRPINAVPETKPVSELLKEMQEDGIHMVTVVDEYGNTAGLVTMEDLVEELVGEIRDEHEPTRDVHQEPDGAYVVSGSFDLDHLHDLLEFRPEAETESTTVGGLVTEWTGRVPAVGDAVERDGIRIEVLAGNELRVEQVRISRAVRTPHAEEA